MERGLNCAGGREEWMERFELSRREGGMDGERFELSRREGGMDGWREV